MLRLAGWVGAVSVGAGQGLGSFQNEKFDDPSEQSLPSWGDVRIWLKTPNYNPRSTSATPNGAST